MALITKKGTPNVPLSVRELSPELYMWLGTVVLKIPEIRTYQESLNPTSVAATTYSEQTFTVAGLTTEDIVVVNPPALTSGLYVISSRVSADDTLSLVFYNSTGSPIDEGAGTYKISTIKI